jgi:hypothetical protein
MAKAWISTASPSEKYDRARQRTEAVVAHVRHLLISHETNQIVLYSPLIADQVPRSYAAHAFAALQRSLLLNQLVRLSAIWDGYGDDRESIPVIARLLDDKDVQAEAVEAVRSRWRRLEPHATDDTASGEDLRRWARNAVNEEADERADEAAKALPDLVERILDYARSDIVLGLRDYRNQFIAHNLDRQSLDRAADVATPRHGDEAEILDKTIEIVDLLYVYLHGTSFVWDRARDLAHKCASDFWGTCRFEVDSGR